METVIEGFAAYGEAMSPGLPDPSFYADGVKESHRQSARLHAVPELPWLRPDYPWSVAEPEDRELERVPYWLGP